MVKHELFEVLPQGQVYKVFNESSCDISYEFLGFTEIYKNLSMIIPLHFTVVDLGCGYNAQCFYFSQHKRYVSVDAYKHEKFKCDNCDIYEKSIEDFIKDDIGQFNLDETFAICSYVPPWGGDNMAMVRAAFKCVFTYYPYGGGIDQFKIKEEYGKTEN